ncbi:DUF1963 domain-containing protein [Parapedobacter tibetensis]|uniref:DUF1963 domain-containing protein n=1 Tax=Parapedobacter tibetensis TaxID=2972951 RepID=UPI00214D744D|nr:DUF1963 domain-containing protein [Parapedobacter tibetensis]
MMTTHIAPTTDSEEFFRVDGRPFTYLDSSEILIPAFSDTGNDLSMTLKARADNYNEKLHAHILNDYEEGEVYFTFSLKQIYRNGIPTGRIRYEKERDTSGHVMWKGGFKYDLELSEELTLADGWVRFDGYFHNMMGTKRYAVQFAKQLPIEGLAWQHYRFTSLEELRTAPANVPRHIQLDNIDAETLPEELYVYTELESLTLYYDYGVPASYGLREIPQTINRFTKLKQLALTRMQRATVIPQTIGDLHELRNLYITGSQATSVPESVAALPNLEYCVLSNNRLTTLPDRFSSSIKSLALEGNQLKTLPKSLVALPNLTRLDINKNPLKSLPPGLERIENLELEIEKKQALLDYAYKGADGKGSVAFDDSIFYARNDTALAQMLDKVLADDKWADYREGLNAVALWAVALETTGPDDYDTKGNTRFGGLPDLPKGIAYPTFTSHKGDLSGYQFIAQLNCEELAPYQSYLPREGMLYFFITDQEDLGARVIYHPWGAETLVPGTSLGIKEEDIHDDFGIYEPHKAAASPYACIPHFYNDDHFYAGAAEKLADLEENYEAAEELRAAFEQASGQRPVHGINGYVFKQHDSPQIEAANKLKGNPEDFVVLLRVSSDNNTGFSFWDAGEIYFVIHKSDLAKGDFSNVFCGLESS